MSKYFSCFEPFRLKIELLKNSIVAINKTASIAHFNETETNGELIFQQL